MTQEMVNKRLVERYVEAVGAGDPRAVREFFAADASWTLQAGHLPMSGTWEGRDRIIDGFFATAMSQSEPDSVQLEVTAMVAEHDHVVLVWKKPSIHPRRPSLREWLHRPLHHSRRAIAAVREYMDTLRLGDVFQPAAPSAAGA